MTTKNVRITTSIVDTKYAPMINVVITDATIIKGIGMSIRAIGAPGINGTSTQENTHIYTNMEDITAKMRI
ncbi:MAG: hypothetical protein JRI29_05685 [Deltaproteobacteria bacterium]|nr:hypothetical protein [Deltaproteobacteria bacterium]